jgi:hypothetical protein
MERLNYKEELDLLRKGGFTFTEITRLYQLRRAYVATLLISLPPLNP